MFDTLFYMWPFHTDLQVSPHHDLIGRSGGVLSTRLINRHPNLSYCWRSVHDLKKKKKIFSSQKSSVKGSNSGVDVECFLTTASDFSTVSVSIKAELMHSLTLLCVLCNQENVTLPCSSCVLILECLSAIKYCTLVLFCCIRLWISVAQTACLSAKERQSTDWWVLCVCAGMCVWAGSFPLGSHQFISATHPTAACSK